MYEISYTGNGENGFLCLVDDDALCRIMAWPSGERISTFMTMYDFGGRRVVMSADGSYFAAASHKKGVIVVHNMMSGERIWEFKLNGVQELRFSGNGDSNLMVSSDDSPLTAFSLRDGSSHKFHGIMRLLCVGASNSYVCETSNSLVVLDMTSGQILRQISPQAIILADACFIGEAVVLCYPKLGCYLWEGNLNEPTKIQTEYSHGLYQRCTSYPCLKNRCLIHGISPGVCRFFMSFNSDSRETTLIGIVPWASSYGALVGEHHWLDASGCLYNISSGLVVHLADFAESLNIKRA